MKKLLSFLLFIFCLIGHGQDVYIIGYKGTFITTSYANAGGTGDRTASITVTEVGGLFANAISQFVDGATASGNIYVQGYPAVVGLWLQFDFGTEKVIDEAKFYQQANLAQGTWKWQGSNNGSSWTDIGTSFALTGTTQTITALSGNQTSYRYYRILGVSGTASGDAFVNEFEFKIG